MITLGDHVALQATSSTPPVLINWSSDNGLSQTGGLTWSFQPPQSMQVICDMQDSLGCVDTGAITITVTTLYEFDMPNAFTPNGDQHNDVFKPVFRGDIFKEYHLSVYSRWGQRVFDTTTPGDGWDGEINGKPLESDVYLYVFEYQLTTGEKGAVKDQLTMLR